MSTDDRALLEEAAHQASALTGLSAFDILRGTKALNQCLVPIRAKAARNERRDMLAAEKAAQQSKANEPTPERSQKGKIVDGEAFLEGSDKRTVTVRKAEVPIDRLFTRKSITKRQHEAAQLFLDHWEVGIMGGRAPMGDSLLRTGAKGTWPRALGLGEAQIYAGNAWAACVLAMRPYHTVVREVVCEGKGLEDLAKPRERKEGTGRIKSSVADKLMWQLRRGLDLAGDSYQMHPRDVVTTEVVVDEASEKSKTVTILYRHEADGKISGVLFNDVPWLASGRGVGEILDLARKRARMKGKK